MVFPIAGGNESKGYDVSNSVRLNDGDNAQLDKTFGSGGDLDKFTVSMWIKISTLASTPDSANYPFIAVNSSPGSNMGFRIRNTDLLQWYHYSAVDGDAGYKMDLRTSMLLRDPSAWYHIVGVYDSANGTEAQRGRMYVNGVEATLTGTPVYPSSGLDGIMGGQIPHSIGGYPTSGGQFDGYITEMHYVDGQALAPTSFGEFDDNGVWIPKKYSGSHGTVGFYLQFKQTGTSANSSGIGADTSGNDNHFTPTNLAATDITEDTCTNNFATFNPLYVDLFNQERTLSEGNTEVDFAGNSARGAVSLTQAVNNGKWYFEIKVVDNSGFYPIVGSINENASQTAPYGRRSTGTAIAYDTDGTLKYENSNTSYGSALSNGDILQIALDMDNHLLWFGINGTWQNSATQSEIENSTATNDATTKTEQDFLTNFDDITIFMQDVNSSGNAHAQLNTGNPAFAISSGNTDGKYGNFEYAPPSGYYALCTKRLAEFG